MKEHEKDEKPAAKPGLRIDETVEGGRYIVNGVVVNAEGERIE